MQNLKANLEEHRQLREAERKMRRVAGRMRMREVFTATSKSLANSH